MTIAQDIYTRFIGATDDGFNWVNAQGELLFNACTRARGMYLVQGTTARWHFPDGSGILVAEKSFDIGYTGNEYRDCFCSDDSKICLQTSKWSEHWKSCPHYGDE